MRQKEWSLKNKGRILEEKNWSTTSFSNLSKVKKGNLQERWALSQNFMSPKSMFKVLDCSTWLHDLQSHALRRGTLSGTWFQLRDEKLHFFPEETQPRPCTPVSSARLYKNLKHWSSEVELKRNKEIMAIDCSSFMRVRPDQMLADSAWSAVLDTTKKKQNWWTLLEKLCMAFLKWAARSEVK